MHFCVLRISLFCGAAIEETRKAHAQRKVLPRLRGEEEISSRLIDYVLYLLGGIDDDSLPNPISLTLVYVR
jgi:hypothetical protein